MRLKSSISLSRLALPSLAACEPCMSKGSAQGNHEGYGPKEGRQFPQRLHSQKGMPEKQTLEPKHSRGNSLIFTSPRPPPIVEENEYKTFTVGVTHFVSLSSPFWGSLNAGICSRRT